MTPQATSGFWAGGAEEALRALEEERSTRLIALAEERDAAEDPEAVRRIEERMAEVRREYADRRKAIENSLF